MLREWNWGLLPWVDPVLNRECFALDDEGLTTGVSLEGDIAVCSFSDSATSEGSQTRIDSANTMGFANRGNVSEECDNDPVFSSGDEQLS